jgi:S-DNA-T family DNA segregation ATPase FtsK/SpoIIIE
MADKAKQGGKLYFTTAGILSAGGLLIGSKAMEGIASMSFPAAIPLAGLLGVGGIALDYIMRDSKYSALFEGCGLINKDGKLPIVIKTTKDSTNQKTLIVHMPEGISQKHFEQKQQELEQFLNSKIEFGFNKELVMKLTSISLKSCYDFIFKEQEKPLQIYCGETNFGPFILDIEQAPHIILAGETGSGKSSLLDVIAIALIQSKHNVELFLQDFQAVGMGKYETCKKVKFYGEKPEEFDLLLQEMEEESKRRLALFRSVKNKVFIDKLSTWNETYPEKALPYRIILADECNMLAEEEHKPLMEKLRSRGAMDRKVGQHYIISINRPDVSIIAGSIKANFPTRFAFRTCTEVDSMVILDTGGAEKLDTAGRFIAKYMGRLTEVQALYIDSKKIRNYLKQHKLTKSFDEAEAEERQKKKQAEERNKAQQEELRKKAIEEELVRKQAESAKAKADQVKENLINMFHQNNGNPYKKGV